MTQPALGLLSSAIVMAIALGFISLFDFGTFAGWVAFVMLGLIPMQVVAVVLWGGNPAFASGLRQPVKGVVLVLVTAIATAVITPLVFMTVGEGAAPPGPIPSHYAVIVVPTTFWLDDHDGWMAVQSCELEPDRFRSAHAGRGVRRDVCRLPSLLQLRLPAGSAGVSPVGAEGDVQRRVSAGVLRHGARRHVPRAVLRSVAAHVVARNHEAACAWPRVDGNRADRRCTCDHDRDQRSRRGPDGVSHRGHGSFHLRLDHRPEHAAELALRANDAAPRRA